MKDVGLSIMHQDRVQGVLNQRLREMIIGRCGPKVWNSLLGTGEALEIALKSKRVDHCRFERQKNYLVAKWPAFWPSGYWNEQR
jgi:hypothetical protein